MRAGPAIDRFDLVSNGCALCGTLAALLLVSSIHAPNLAPSVATAETTAEIALDLSTEPEASDPPAPEPAQDTPIETPAPELIEPTPTTLDSEPVVAPTKPPRPKQERPKREMPKTKAKEAEEKPRRVRSEHAGETREKPARAGQSRGEAAGPTRSQSSGNAAAFRACLAGAPYPSSKDARLQKPSGSVGIVVSGGGASVSRSSGSAILDQAARSRAMACASAAGGGTLSGVVVFHPR